MRRMDAREVLLRLVEHQVDSLDCDLEAIEDKSFEVAL